ncbi:MAG: ATP-NAD kinase family protein [Syntrophomonadaceae bacterium]|jgi:predicted polyphosphate/ATP-dependent NAD kinase
MSTVGIIANPASGKDIRRLVAYGITFDNLEKVNIVRRALLGLAATGVDHVVYMPEYYGIVERAVDGLSVRHKLPIELECLDMEITRMQEDSAVAAGMMNELAVSAIITLGGDGTNRVVAKGCGMIPLVPVSTGTNNVFPEMVEGTIAGLAAGVVAQGLVTNFPGIYTSKRIVIYKNGIEVDHALVDAVVLADAFIGSRAVWDEGNLRQIVVTRGEPDTIGISAVAGNLEPVGVASRKGMVINIGPGNMKVMAPIAPGLIKPIDIKDYRILEVGDEISVAKGRCVIALDGEREVEVSEADTVTMKLQSDGPRVVDVNRALRDAVAQGYSKGEKVVKHLNWLKEEI